MPSELIAALANIPGERTGQVFGFKSRGKLPDSVGGGNKTGGH